MNDDSLLLWYQTLSKNRVYPSRCALMYYIHKDVRYMPNLLVCLNMMIECRIDIITLGIVVNEWIRQLDCVCVCVWCEGWEYDEVEKYIGNFGKIWVYLHIIDIVNSVVDGIRHKNESCEVHNIEEFYWINAGKERLYEHVSLYYLKHLHVE